MISYADPKRGGEARLRRSADMNKSLLAKLGWNILNCEKESVCKVLRDKYGIFDDKPLILKHK